MMDRNDAHARNDGILTKRRAFLIIAGMAVFLAVAADWAAAQLPIQWGPGGRRGQFQGEVETESLDGVFLPVDRDTSRQFERAKQLSTDGRYSDAITLLDEILQRHEDFFIQTPTDKQSFPSLKSEAQRLIGAMPPEGRQAYELQFGAKAQQMLTAAAASGDITKLEEVARRFFHTQAGYQATMLLGRRLLDHGHALAAAECFKRLSDAPAAAEKLEPQLTVLLATSWLKADKADLAKQALDKLRARDSQATLKVAGKSVRLFQEKQPPLALLQDTIERHDSLAAAALESWTLVRGDAARNATSAGGLPLMNPRWRVSTTNHPELERAISDKRKEYIDRQTCFLPVMQPLAIGDVVLMRSLAQPRGGRFRHRQAQLVALAQRFLARTAHRRLERE